MSEPALGSVVPTSSAALSQPPVDQTQVAAHPVTQSIMQASLGTQSVVPEPSSVPGQVAAVPAVVQPGQPVPAVQPDPIQTMAPAVPQYVQQQTDTLNPSFAGSSPTTAKEVAQPGIKLERPQLDADLSGQVTEVEPARELEMPPEVDGFLKKVENNPQQIPQEVVIVNDPAAPPPTKYLAKPVIVLPITPEIEKQGKNQSAKMSVSWLVVWSRKIMKMFTGEVVYRQST